MNAIQKWLNKHTQPVTQENTYTPKIRVQSTVDEGKGMTLNEKAEHIFNEIKKR